MVELNFFYYFTWYVPRHFMFSWINLFLACFLFSHSHYVIKSLTYSEFLGNYVKIDLIAESIEQVFSGTYCILRPVLLHYRIPKAQEQIQVTIAWSPCGLPLRWDMFLTRIGIEEVTWITYKM